VVVGPHPVWIPSLTGSEQGGVNDSLIGGLLRYFGPPGWWTAWYWPPGTRGKVHNWLHGRGWRIG
jgi:hypothetical protein